MFRSLMDISPAMVWMTDVDGRCTFVSKECLRFTGQMPEGPNGFIWMDRVHPDDADEMKKSFDLHTLQHTPFFRDYRLLHHSGDYRWVADSGHPHFDEFGNYIGYVGMIVDIHERKLLEFKLKDQLWFLHMKPRIKLLHETNSKLWRKKHRLHPLQNLNSWPT
ncbi:MAG: PAS domain S-box protein [Proteobacteria bacterium]|nr:PAS domain S-box protein [Pseudomonadota bacterium]